MKTLVMTVPYSGTHFILKFLVGVLGLDGNSAMCTAESNCDFAHIHPNGEDISDGIFDSAIITLRHPHKSIRTAHYRGGKEGIINSWRSMIDELEKYDTVLPVLIDGPEENHFPQLFDIAVHFGKGHLRSAVKQYADEWTPLNASLTDEDINAVEFARQAYEQWQ